MNLTYYKRRKKLFQFYPIIFFFALRSASLGHLAAKCDIVFTEKSSRRGKYSCKVDTLFPLCTNKTAFMSLTLLKKQNKLFFDAYVHVLYTGHCCSVVEFFFCCISVRRMCCRYIHTLKFYYDN